MRHARTKQIVIPWGLLHRSLALSLPMRFAMTVWLRHCEENYDKPGVSFLTCPDFSSGSNVPELPSLPQRCMSLSRGDCFFTLPHRCLPFVHRNDVCCWGLLLHPLALLLSQ